ncbi:hypothetical protein [Sphingomonas sp.]|uniref:hypothetical protein n=1 Tax=Sphingomonas sp. TaxID=28214 RepID=UPI000DB3974C|nr:hypothetical protein [Sphingomonas sp.]PZU08511.1 MAG: hypothetical protein DI605_11075 [Sphingomonas sp.]
MNTPIQTAAEAVVPAVPDETALIFQRLRGLRDACGDASSTDTILVLISAALDEGFDTRPRILGALFKLGYDRARVAKLLDAQMRVRWRSRPGRRYEAII